METQGVRVSRPASTAVFITRAKIWYAFLTVAGARSFATSWDHPGGDFLLADVCDPPFPKRRQHRGS